MLFVFNACGSNPSESSSHKTFSEQSKTTSQEQEEEHSSEEEIEVNSTNTHIKVQNETLKVIDLLVLVDKQDKNNFNGMNETKIDHFISVSNKVYKNSGLDIKLNIKKIHAYDFAKEKSEDVLYEVYKDKQIKQLRADEKADLVVIYRKYAQDGYCGIAYVNHTLSADIGYAHVSLECTSITTAHEIGHNMGLRHSLLNTKKTGVFDYARGYGVESEFVTVMGYQSTYHTKNQMFNYSSPEIDCEGYACGVDSELDNGANAVKALKYASGIVAAFR
jgi:hypothetical protein